MRDNQWSNRCYQDNLWGFVVSLIFGILVSTVLTLVVIPLLYYTLLKRVKTAPASRPLAVAPEQTP